MSAGVPRPSAQGARRLLRRQEGQATVEFMLMMVVTLLVVLVVFSLAWLGSEMLLVRYASFLGARAYLAHADHQKAAEKAASWVPGATGQVRVEVSEGEGVKVSVQVREAFPLRTMFGGSDRTWLTRETFLGREPEFSGDNQPR
ncbi:MAG: hypothetical protein HY910_02040 [Desulfarculus sp.]|nr:hypothetical protein [Desulfarculus sp.]